MISAQKILTSLLLVVLLSTQYTPNLLAEEARHSLDELPSIRLEEDISDLILEKKMFEATPVIQKEEPQTEISASTLVEERAMYIAADTSVQASPVIMHPGFITDPFMSQIVATGSVFDGFLVNHNISPTLSETRDTSGKIRKERKVGTARGTISTSITPGTIIRTSTGLILPESIIQIDSIDTTRKNKAKKQFEKHMGNRGNAKKGRTEANPEGFEFGLSGTHLIFSQPVAITVNMPHASDGITIDLLTMHEGDADFNTGGLSVDATTACTADGMATIPGAQTRVQGGKFTFYTCGASSFTFNPAGGTTTSNDLRLIIGDYAQAQVYYKGLAQTFGGNPPASGAGGPSHYVRLNIGTTSVGNGGTAWTTATTTGSQVGNNYTATTTMTYGTSPNQYVLVLNWYYTAPNKYLTWNYSLTVPSSNTQNIRLYFGMDSFVAGGDANDVGYYNLTPSQTVGIYDNVANVLSAQRYISGATWSGYYAGTWGGVTTYITSNTNYPNTITTTAGDQGYGINWDFGTTPGTYSSTTEWRILPYVAANVAELSPAIGQPVPAFTVNQLSLIPITVSNAGNAPSSGLHTLVFTIPANFNGPTATFTDNGWSCSAMNITTRQVTCTKTTAIASLGNDSVNIAVTPLPAAGGTNATFSVSLTNASDSNTTNNTASITLQVNVAPQTRMLWLKANNGTSCSTNGCSVNTWNDQSGLGRNATQGTLASQPTYAASVMNFNPGVNFGGSNQIMTFASPYSVSSGSTIYVVGQPLASTASWRTLWRSATGQDHLMIGQAAGTQFGYYDNNVGSGFRTSGLTWSPGETALLSSVYGATTATFSKNSQPGTAITGLTVSTNALTYLGNYQGGGQPFGIVSEVMVYNTTLSQSQQDVVESYLSIKYGITRNQTTARNYTLSDNGTIWNATTAGVYKNDIAGIANDTAMGLNQIKSQSINNTGDIIVEDISLPLADKSALTWANDAGSTGSFVSTDAPTTQSRITREWRFQEKNTDTGNVKISYPASALPGGFTGTLKMYVDTDGVFALGATTYTGTLSAGNYEFTVNIADGDYITFGRDADITPPVISSTSIASGTLIPLGNFALTYNYTDTGAGISPSTATGRIYSWNSGTTSYNPTPLAGYMTLGTATSTTATMNIANLPYGRYRFDLTIADTVGNTTTQSYTYFVDAIEWTISADTYNMGNIVQNTTSFGTGELLVTVKTVGAGFSLTTAPISMLAIPPGDTIPYWNTSYGVGYDLWNGSAFLGNILTYSPNATLATIAKNINVNGEKNTFVYRIKYGAKVDFMQAAGDYNGTVNFGISLSY